MRSFRITNSKLLRFLPKASLVIFLRLSVFIMNLATASILAHALDFKGRSDVAVLVSLAGISVILTTYVTGEEMMRRKQVITGGIESNKVPFSIPTPIVFNCLILFYMSKTLGISLISAPGVLVLLYLLGSTLNSILLAEHFCIHGIVKQQILQVVYQFTYLLILSLNHIFFTVNLQNWLISIILGESVLIALILRRRNYSANFIQIHWVSYLGFKRRFNWGILIENSSVILAAMFLSLLPIIMNTQSSNYSLTANFVIAISMSTLVYMPFSSFFPLLISEAKGPEFFDLDFRVKRIFVMCSALTIYLICSKNLIQLSVPIIFGDKYTGLAEVSLVIVLTGSLIGILIAFSAYFRGLRDFAGSFFVVAITLAVFTFVTTFLQQSSLTLYNSLLSLIIGLIVGNCFAICRIIFYELKK